VFAAHPQIPFIPDALVIVPVPGQEAWVYDIRKGGHLWFAAFGSVPAGVFAPMHGKTFTELMEMAPEKFRPSFEIDAHPVGPGETLEVDISGPIVGLAWWGRVLPMMSRAQLT